MLFVKNFLHLIILELSFNIYLLIPIVLNNILPKILLFNYFR